MFLSLQYHGGFSWPILVRSSSTGRFALFSTQHICMKGMFFARRYSSTSLRCVPACIIPEYERSVAAYSAARFSSARFSIKSLAVAVIVAVTTIRPNANTSRGLPLLGDTAFGSRKSSVIPLVNKITDHMRVSTGSTNTKTKPTIRSRSPAIGTCRLNRRMKYNVRPTAPSNTSAIPQAFRMSAIVKHAKCCNQALSQLCAFYSPFSGSMSDMAILRQLTS